MPAGVEITTDGVTKVLDQNLQQYFHKLKSSQLTATNNVTQLGASKLVISYTGSASSKPLCAVVPGTVNVMYYSTSRSSNTWTWTFITSAAVGTSIAYHIFDLPAGPSPNYGLEVYNEAGVLTFASYEKPLRIRAIGTGTVSTPTFGATVNGDAGRSYAGISGRFSGFTEIGLGTAFNTEAIKGYALVMQGGGGSLGLAVMQHSQGPDAPTGTYGPADTEQYGDYQVLLIDVTSY